MAFKMRQSKFRHVFGQPLKRDQCFDNIRISKSSIESLFCAVNPKYVGIVTEAAGGGAFLVLPIERTGRVERDHPMVVGHKGPVLDIKWCPHNDDVIASASDDATIKVWQIPDEGVLENLTEPIVDLEAHIRRVTRIEWHPTALNLLLSAGADNKMFLWNCGTGEAILEIETPDVVLSMSFNYDGTRFATTCKDKMLRVFETRSGDTIVEHKVHDGSKPAQCAYLKDEKIFTTGFSRMSERQYACWDVNNMSSPMTIEMIDNSNGVIFPFYDSDTGMVFLCGKGDSIIRYYEVTDEAPFVHYLNLFQSKDAQRGIGYMPKRGLNVNSCEIARFYKLLNNGVCEVIPMTVPRKISLRSGYISSKKEKILVKKNVLDPNVPKAKPKLGGKAAPQSQPAKPAPSVAANGAVETPKATAPAHVPAAASAPAPAPVQQPATPPQPAGPTLPADFDAQALQDDIRKLKLIVKAHERRIKTLEDKVAGFEANTSEEEDGEAA
ncbi:COR1C-like protein [Mya arenaria]|uniref:Coronin n=1 Tax=Mya arenaria TaxID=6604 RepID=A0ABY7E220_MYAAR|nr:COR1C-like protein [Mya arenaria]